MKMNTKAVCSIIGLTALAFTAALAKSHNVGGHGTDILHLSIRNTMVNEGIEPGASGNVALSQNIQGKANKQTLGITVNGLTADTAYELLAAKGDDTNMVDVTQFTTDGSGSASLQYRTQSSGKAKGHGAQVPDGLAPLRDVRTIAIGNFATNVIVLVTNVTTNIVLTADMTGADKLQYLVKRDISSNNIPALLHIKATQDKAQFRLLVSSLAPTTDYTLAVNDAPEQIATTDANGFLTVSGSSTNGDILTVRSVALWDTSSNVIVSTTLP